MDIGRYFDGTGILLAYALTTIPMIVALIQGRAAAHKYFLAPVLALILTAPLELLASAATALLQQRLPAFRESLRLVLLCAFPAVGYLAGRIVARSISEEVQQRGTLIHTGLAAQREGIRLKRKYGDELLTLAGVAIPPDDETRHFMLIGAGDSGKSSALQELVEGALARGDRVIIADRDGCDLKRFYDAQAGDAILDPLDAGSSTVTLSVRQWVREGQGRALFLPYADHTSAPRAMIPSWMRMAMTEIMTDGARDQRLWFIVDELDAIGPMDGLHDALAPLGTFGGRCVLGVQSMAQLSSGYGARQARSIVENCGTALIMRCPASAQDDTAHFASQLVGVPTSQIEQLPDRSGYLRLASAREWLRV